MSIPTSNLIEIAQYHSQNFPDRESYSFLGNGEELTEQLSFSQLDQTARGIAAYFQNALDIMKGQRVILLFVPGLDFVKALYGCFYAGVIAVPVNPPSTGEQSWANFLSIVDNAGASLILADQAKMKFLERQEIVTKQGVNTRIVDIDNIDLSLANDYVTPQLNDDDTALLQYTSGTTSMPKGVMVSHKNIMHNLHIINEQIYQGHNVTVSWLPIYHDMGLFGAVLQAMYVGGHCILMPPSSFLMKPIRWLRAINRFSAGVSGGPNFAFDLCVEAIDENLVNELDLSAWKVAASGAEPVLAPTLRRFGKKFFKCGFNPGAFVPCYGLAESTLLACANKVDRNKPPRQIAVSQTKLGQRSIEVLDQGVADSKEFVSCGKPEAGQIVVVDTATIELLPEDQVGEIWLRSNSVAQGYWNNPEQTQTVFGQSVNNEEGYYRTGDLGFMHEQQIYISGRIKDLIIIRGRNHYPGDIEHTLQSSRQELILDSGAVFGVELRGVERVVALQEVKRTAIKQLDTEVIINAIHQAIGKAHNIAVDAVVLLKPGAIYKTSSGKIRRSACRDTFLAGGFDEETVGIKLSGIIDALLQGKIEAHQGLESDPATNTGHEESACVFDFRKIFEVAASELLQYLVEQTAEAFEMEPSDIEPGFELSHMGIDSLDAVDMMTGLTKALGLSNTDPIWDCENLVEIAYYIAKIRGLNLTENDIGVVAKRWG